MMSNSAVPEGRGHLVLDDLDLDPVADDLVALLDGRHPPDVDPQRGVELEGPAAGRRLRVAQEEADLLPDLVDEDEAGFGPGHDGGQLAQGLAHQPGLQAHVGVAHLALQLGLGDEGRDRVDDDDIDRPAADQDLGDFQPLFAVIGLGDEQVVDVDPDSWPHRSGQARARRR